MKNTVIPSSTGRAPYDRLMFESCSIEGVASIDLLVKLTSETLRRTAGQQITILFTIQRNDLGELFILSFCLEKVE
jgi:hypothetical protein